MIAGGSEAAITPMGVSGFANMKALSERNDDPARASRPFDADRDGLIMREEWKSLEETTGWKGGGGHRKADFDRDEQIAPAELLQAISNGGEIGGPVSEATIALAHDEAEWCALAVHEARREQGSPLRIGCFPRGSLIVSSRCGWSRL